MLTIHDSSGKEMKKTLIAKLIIISSVQINPAVWGRKYEKKKQFLMLKDLKFQSDRDSIELKIIVIFHGNIISTKKINM